LQRLCQRRVRAPGPPPRQRLPEARPRSSRQRPEARYGSAVALDDERLAPGYPMALPPFGSDVSSPPGPLSLRVLTPWPPLPSGEGGRGVGTWFPLSASRRGGEGVRAKGIAGGGRSEEDRPEVQ